MRIREENRNLVLLSTVALLSAAIAGGAALLQLSQAPVAEKKPVYLASQPVRVVGSPFVPKQIPASADRFLARYPAAVEAW